MTGPTTDATAPVAAATDAEQLLAFNGYYALGGAPGAFFAVDGNIAVVAQPYAAALTVNLLFCLDGKNAFTLPFAGSFDGTRLVQRMGSLEIVITFARPASAFGVSATVSGAFVYHLTERSQVKIEFAGATYNNPIPMALFAGDYFLPATSGGAPVQVATIAVDTSGQISILYDWGTGDGTLSAAAGFTYNCNMYYFSLIGPSGPAAVPPKLIMGATTGQGFACNDIDPVAASLSRNLFTIPGGGPSGSATSAPSAQALASFSGYYALNIAPGAFVSISGRYLCMNGVIDAYQVGIGFSLDGVTSTSFWFDSSMSFDPATGALSAPCVALTFSSGFDPATGTLARVSGTVGGLPAAGSTYFNPVPLSAFGPARLTDKTDANAVQVLGDTSVAYVTAGGVASTIDTFIYVPLMYIVGTQIDSSELILSLGTDGPRGLACIVMAGTSVGAVWALPDAT
jgi:hypothetical protein